MSLRPRKPSLRRAAIAVLALYGLLLQGFLAAATAAPVPGLPGLLCLQHGGNGAGSGDLPLAAQHGCCTLACPGGLAGPPLPSGAAAVLPWRVATRIAWAPETAAPWIAPLVQGASARGPPLR